MTWFLIILGLSSGIGLLWWWLSRPLWYRSQGVRELENFLRDLVSPHSPWPYMYVVSQGTRYALCFSRHHVDPGVFHLRLCVSLGDSSGEQVARLVEELQDFHFLPEQISVTKEQSSLNLALDFGQADSSVLSEATQASRVLLEHLGLNEEGELRIRYAGTLDARIAVPALEQAAGRAGALTRLMARAGLRQLKRQ